MKRTLVRFLLFNIGVLVPKCLRSTEDKPAINMAIFGEMTNIQQFDQRLAPSYFSRREPLRHRYTYVEASLVENKMVYIPILT